MSDPSFNAGQTLPASELQKLGEYGTWTPTLTVVSGTNPNLGVSPTTDGEYHRNGRLITLFVNITFGSSGTAQGSGTYQIGGLPFPIDTFGAGAAAGGNLFANDNSAGQRFLVVPRVQSTTAVTMVRTNITATEFVTEVTNNLPFPWGADDSIRGTIVYLGTT